MELEKQFRLKNKFESWLWDTARVSVKHYHCDDGVFTADAFTGSCKEEGKSQTFSGVGAQHQNTEAERSIQYVVYMDRIFMIHCDLHWGGAWFRQPCSLVFCVRSCGLAVQQDPANAHWLDAFGDGHKLQG